MAIYFSDTDIQTTPLNMIFSTHPTEPEHFVRRSRVPESRNPHPMKSLAPTDRALPDGTVVPVPNSPEATEPTDLVRGMNVPNST